MRHSIVLLASAIACLALLGCPPDEEEAPTPTPDPAPVACGGWLGDTCESDEFCLYEEGQTCGWADASGECATPPDACYQVYAPVCGCDGETYSNDCVAHAAGTSVLHTGACDCEADQPYVLAGPEVIGVWQGTGAWPVEWQFTAGGVTKIDYIAPCPADVACFWSGIVYNSGTWTVANNEVELSWSNASNMAGATTPDTLRAYSTCSEGGTPFTLTEITPANTEIVYSEVE